jgi:hypothetical protein
MAKVTMIALETINGGELREFEADHAERILRMPRSGWRLPSNSEFEYKDGFITRRDTKKKQ